jgi:alcohol dehydrogenase class IV
MRQARDLAFTVPAIATRTVFGAFALGRLAEELQRLGALRPLIVTSPGQRILGERVARTLERVAGIHPVALPGVPRVAVDDTVAEIHRQRADSCLAVGGGTAIGLAKAAGPEAGVPILAAPTTCSGAELTPLVRVREASGMAVREDARAVPLVALYEPDLAAPPAVLAVSALAAIAHCLPLLTAEDAAPAMLALAQAGVAALVRAIGRLAQGDPDPEWRTLALYGGWLGGLCLAASPGPGAPCRVRAGGRFRTALRRLGGRAAADAGPPARGGARPHGAGARRGPGRISGGAGRAPWRAAASGRTGFPAR